MDYRSLLSYLLIKETPAPSEQVEYTLKTILANVNERPVLAPNPHFVNYILDATGPGQVCSICNIGLKVLVAACQSIVPAYDADILVTLASNCDPARLLRRAILNQDPPTMLKDLLRINDEEFSETS